MASNPAPTFTWQPVADSGCWRYFVVAHEHLLEVEYAGDHWRWSIQACYGNGDFIDQGSASELDDAQADAEAGLLRWRLR